MTQILTLSIARTADGNGLALPSYTSKYHMGLNLQLASAAAVRLEPGDRAYVPVGFVFGVPSGYCGYVISHPNMARSQGIVVADAPRLVSPADREPLFVLLQNISAHLVVLHRGDMIAHLVVQPVVQVAWQDLSSTSSGGKTTSNTNMVQEGFSESNDRTGVDRMTSQKRVYKDARHRFENDDEEEDK